ncbi:uncharacterized protein LOC113360045 [Papaver somniferum]|uniref:uncharacterized protein LOC113360045 n=1 Tax=Papaver somniferum TaxID=3469 RepID=UPI000E6F6768|nr:uncharacterized protein LOC113360045 [Papaver somniferum]
MVVNSAIDGSWSSKINNSGSKRMGTLIDLSSLPEASKHGDDTAIMIPDELLDNSLDEWKFSLIGRLDFQKLKIELADRVLKDQWKLKGNSQLIPMGKGFFVIELDNEDDQNRIWSGGLWQVENQILKVREWEPNFKHENQKSSTAFVWAHFPGLCIEYWKEEIILSIAKTIGRAIQVDETTLKREIGYYASMMVEVDLAKEIPGRIWIGTKYGGFYQDIKIPKVPKFCGQCKIVGHIVSECRVSRKDQNKPEEGEIVDEGNKYRKKGKNTDKEEKFVGASDPKDDVTIDTIPVVDARIPVANAEVGIKLSKAFHALKDMEDNSSINELPNELPMDISKPLEIVSSTSLDNAVKGAIGTIHKDIVVVKKTIRKKIKRSMENKESLLL